MSEKSPKRRLLARARAKGFRVHAGLTERQLKDMVYGKEAKHRVLKSEVGLEFREGGSPGTPKAEHRQRT